ncbi:MAG: DUF934 domain-containing protein [Rhodospirillaceae bacterium]|nr:DUF934 domain-containing protein [Rhodospirillaceae bacterium]
MPLVTRAGFAPVEPVDFVAADAAAESDGEGVGVDLPNHADPQALVALFDRIALIRIAFPSSSDGRGFSLARRLRQLGYRGRLRAHGHVISDQFRHALACGFDEVEIDEDLAARQPEAHWRVSGQPQRTYGEKLGRRPVAPPSE